MVLLLGGVTYRIAPVLGPRRVSRIAGADIAAPGRGSPPAAFQVRWPEQLHRSIAIPEQRFVSATAL